MAKRELGPLKSKKQPRLKLPGERQGPSALLHRKDITSFYDTWPLHPGVTKDTKPSLLAFVEELLSRGLSGVARSYPRQAPAGLTRNPFEEHPDDDARAEDAVRRSQMRCLEIRDLPFRLERVRSFTGALCTLASGFKTYRPFMLWCTHEIATFNDYLLGLIDSIGQKVKDVDNVCHRKDGEKAEREAQHQEELAVLASQIADARRSTEDEIKERDRGRLAVEDLQDQVRKLECERGDSERTNQVLLCRIRKLEKKLCDPSIVAAQETVLTLSEKLEEELQTTQELRRCVSDLTEEGKQLRRKFHELEKNYPVETHPKYAKVSEEVRSVREMLEHFRGGHVTPRPKWDAIPSHIIEYSDSTTTTVDKLVTETIRCRQALDKSTRNFSSMTRLRSSPSQKWMAGLGFDGVPPFLQAEGRIPNTQISKRQAEFMIREIWRERSYEWKTGAGAGGAPTSRISEFYLDHLVKRYPRDYMQVSYNFLATLQLYYHDPDCQTFLRCLFDEVSETVVQLQADVVRTLKESITAQGAVDGRISKQALESLVAAEHGEDVLQALEEDLAGQEGAMVEWMQLFKNDHHLNESRLVESVRNKVLLDRDDFVGLVEDKVLELDKPQVTRREALAALIEADPKQSLDLATLFVSGAFTQTHTLEVLRFIQYVRKSHQCSTPAPIHAPAPIDEPDESEGVAEEPREADTVQE